ncbi:MAG: transporter substrate-binding domain-containing protein [Blautia sp.]|nr:transporter substrate-binding domain-containing protein [Blautia sp.]
MAMLLTGALAASMVIPVMAEDAKHFTIATDTVFKPFEYTDTDGNFVGIDVDILAAIAEDQGFTYDLNSLGWDSAIAACQAKQADGMIAGASITDERKESGWIFSDGYFMATQSMTVKDDSDIKGFEDLEGKTVGVKTGTQGAAYAESLKEEYGFDITYFEDSPTMYQAVVGGQVVSCFEDTPIMITSIQDGSLPLKVLTDTANDGAPYGFAVFNEDGQELIDLFNAGLANIIENGTYEEIVAKYLGEETAAASVKSFTADAEEEDEDYIDVDENEDQGGEYIDVDENEDQGPVSVDETEDQGPVSVDETEDQGPVSVDETEDQGPEAADDAE